VGSRRAASWRLLYFAWHILGRYDLPLAFPFEPSVGSRELDRMFPTIFLGVDRTLTAVQNGHGIAKEMHLDLEPSQSRCAYSPPRQNGSGCKISIAHRTIHGAPSTIIHDGERYEYAAESQQEAQCSV
jgi:hypothetical protein